MSSSLSILLVQPMASTSHHIWTMSLLKGLLRKGHHVHIVDIHEPKIKGKLAQNMTYAVSTYNLDILDKTIIFNAQYKLMAYN